MTAHNAENGATGQSENVRLAAAWQAGFDAATVNLLVAAADSEKRGHAAAMADLKPVTNPYLTGGS